MCKPLLQHLDRIEQQDTDERKKNDCSPDIAAMDLFVAPTIGFDLLYVLVIVRLERRKLVWINVTPSDRGMDRTSDHRGIPLGRGPRYLIRDRDRVYGAAVTHRLRAMASATSPLPQARPGRTASPKG